ncbi:MAG TPA: translocation/assembly module TamB, partial [Thermodesulforhabdus norvegica]|nr:translocation/assembly module TamB [Thermodesulforhabdus norvegica]
DIISLRGDFQTIKVVLDLDELSDAINKSFPEVEIVEDEGEGELVEESSSTVFERLDMDLNVDCSGGNAWVRGLGIETEVSGNIRIVKRPNDDLHLFGRIASKRGWYSFQSIRLKIVKGQVEFRGVYPPDPGLDIVGEKQVDEVVVRVEIKGRVTEPEFHLSGVPSMSEVDALSYLLFGRPARQLTARESVSMQEQAALLLGSKASRIFKELLGNTPFTPDILNFRRGESGSEVLEIGKYLTPDFYVTYEKDVTEGREDKVDIEYRVNRHISIQSQIGGSGNSGVDVLWRYDFGD